MKDYELIKLSGDNALDADRIIEEKAKDGWEIHTMQVDPHEKYCLWLLLVREFDWRRPR